MKDKFKTLFSEKGRKAAVVLLSLGIFLIFVSEFIPEKKQTEDAEKISVSSSVSYEEALSEKIRSMVKAITGSGEVSVSLTLSKSHEEIYAADENIDTGEKTLIILKDKSGAQTLAKVMQYEPEVKGVVIVFENADNIILKKAVTDAAVSLLGISSNRVCVLKMN